MLNRFKLIKNFAKTLARPKKNEVQREELLDEQTSDDFIRGVPRYPPFKTGLPVVSPKRLIATQDEIIKEISALLGFTDEQLDKYLYPLIEEYANFVHLIPASESHHHKGAGGLFRHGLEVGKFAILFSEEVILSTEGSMEKRNNAEVKWRFAAFICGLLHDIGKPLTDLTVTCREGKKVWVTLGGESLYDWFNRHQIDNYYIHYHHNRHTKHQGVTSVLMAKILSNEIQHFLTEDGNQNIFVAISNAINGTSTMDQLSNVMIKADRASVVKDLKEQSQVEADVNYGVPIVRFVFDAIRSLVNKGDWKLNTIDSGIFNTDIGFFIDFDSRMGMINKEIKALGFEGVPQDKDQIIRIFIEQGYAIPYNIDGQSWYQWEVQLHVNAEKDGMHVPVITRRLVCLADPGQIYSNPPSDTIKAEGIKYVRNAEGKSVAVIVVSSEQEEEIDSEVIDELTLREQAMRERIAKEKNQLDSFSDVNSAIATEVLANASISTTSSSSSIPPKVKAKVRAKITSINGDARDNGDSIDLEDIETPLNHQMTQGEIEQLLTVDLNVKRHHTETPDMSVTPKRKKVNSDLDDFSKLTKAGMITDPSRFDSTEDEIESLDNESSTINQGVQENVAVEKANHELDFSVDVIEEPKKTITKFTNLPNTPKVENKESAENSQKTPIETKSDSETLLSSQKTQKAIDIQSLSKTERRRERAIVREQALKEMEGMASVKANSPLAQLLNLNNVAKGNTGQKSNAKNTQRSETKEVEKRQLTAKLANYKKQEEKNNPVNPVFDLFEFLTTAYPMVSQFLIKVIQYAEQKDLRFGLNQVLMVKGTEVLIKKENLDDLSKVLNINYKKLRTALRNSGAVKANTLEGYAFIEELDGVEGFVLIDELANKIISYLIAQGLTEELALANGEIESVSNRQALWMELNQSKPYSATISERSIIQSENEKLILSNDISLTQIKEVVMKQVMMGDGKYVHGILSESEDSLKRYVPVSMLDELFKDYHYYGFSKRKIQIYLTRLNEGCSLQDDYFVFDVKQINKKYGLQAQNLLLNRHEFEDEVN